MQICSKKVRENSCNPAEHHTPNNPITPKPYNLNKWAGLLLNACWSVVYHWELLDPHCCHQRCVVGRRSVVLYLRNYCANMCYHCGGILLWTLRDLLSVLLGWWWSVLSFLDKPSPTLSTYFKLNLGNCLISWDWSTAPSVSLTSVLDLALVHQRTAS